MDLAPDPSPARPGRKRRSHKRSRNGCLTCKQRHIRCDELKPIWQVTYFLSRYLISSRAKDPRMPQGGVGFAEVSGTWRDIHYD